MNYENGRDMKNQDREESKHKNTNIIKIGMDIVECAVHNMHHSNVLQISM